MLCGQSLNMKSMHRGNFKFDQRETDWPNDAFTNEWDYDHMSDVCMWLINGTYVDLRHWNLLNTTRCIARPIAFDTNNQILHDLMNVGPGFGLRAFRTRIHWTSDLF